MEPGSSSKPVKNPQKPGLPPPKIIERFIPNNDHNPNELKSWAKRTGFNLNSSGETTSSVIERDLIDRAGVAGLNLDKRPDRLNGSLPQIEIEPVSDQTILGSQDGVSGVPEGTKKIGGDDLKGGTKTSGLNGNGDGFENGNRKPVQAVTSTVTPVADPKEYGDKDKREIEIDIFSGSQEPGDPILRRSSLMKCGLRENPGFVPLIFYGVQHYLSMAGSLIFIPLIIVPAMGGTDEETATVISTMILMSGLTTILHLYFGTRLPLVQGSSFVYLAPALVIINSEEFRNLNENKFKHIMKELQGAIIVGSIFQSILGYSGLMSLLLRLINPVVVAPTIAAVGLAFFSYGFPQAGTCIEISVPQILLVLLFALYFRGISIFGHRIFQVYAVPLSVSMVWAYAFFLTEGGAYNYKGCSSNVPSSNILSDACRKHAFTMKHCRTDASSAWRTAAWVRVPYPFQWGMPIFHFRTSIIMIVVSIVASVDSVGSYHAASLLVNSRPPTPGIVSRGIGLEGFSSILAGIWGTGTGSTTLTENVHTIDITKVASRNAIALGAVFLILFSFLGKIGALLASIPLALAASVLCFIWALIVALGISTLQYSQTVSSRNILIVGFTLFISLSVPAYIQQYQPVTSFVLPSYFVPYAAASNGPVHSGSQALDYAINGILSMNMVVAFLIAFILDNTVPGSRQERGVYIWSTADTAENNPSLHADYSLPRRVSKFFRWAKCVGT